MTPTKQRTLILASSSPRRQELIRTLRLPVKIQASHVDESTEAGLSPDRIVETLSLRKAQAVADTLAPAAEATGAIVIGSDTIVVLNGTVLGKPVDRADAFRMLSSLQGRTHEVYSGVACIDMDNAATYASHRRTRVTMRTLSERQIERYIETGEPMDKAGSYAIQGIGATIVEAIEGDYFNVVGLPLSLLADLLHECGIDIL